MKIALVSMMDDNFIPGFVGFYESVNQNSPAILQYEWVFIDVGISVQNKELMKMYKPDIKFVFPKKENYKKINFKKTSPKLQNTYYKLDIIGMTEYDRIVFIDMDVLVLGDISYLFQIDDPIAGVSCYSAGGDQLRSEINTGVVVINKPFINEEYYKNILRLSQQGFSMPDQKAINKFFRGKIKILPKEYNMEKRIINSKRWNWREAKILHFVSRKPWSKGKPSGNNVGFEVMENLWWQYYNGKNFNS